MNPTIIYIAKHLPGFVYRPLSKLYVKWNSKRIWDEELIRDFMEYSNLSYNDTREMLKSGVKLQYDFWNKLDPKTDEEIKKFYETTPYNIFSLAYWHMSRGQVNFRNKIMEYCFGDILDYGGGVGDLCIKLAEKGLNVTYGDVRGKNMEFAKWLFKKRGYEIKVLDIVNEFNCLEEYDTLMCIDVIEHIPHPEVALERMTKHLRNNGRLIITQLNCKGGVPLHLKMNFDGEKLLNELGLVKGHYDWLWIKKTE